MTASGTPTAARKSSAASATGEPPPRPPAKAWPNAANAAAVSAAVAMEAGTVRPQDGQVPRSANPRTAGTGSPRRKGISAAQCRQQGGGGPEDRKSVV